MATRVQIREAFYDELVAAAGGTHSYTDDGGQTQSITVDADDVSLVHPEDETLPQVVYNDDYRTLTFNGVGNGPDMVEYDASGDVSKLIWREYVEAQFLIEIRTGDELAKEPIYEAVRTAFKKYNYPFAKLSSFHADARDIDVRDAQSTDTGDVEEPIRGDSLEIRVQFHRDYEVTPDVLQTVEHEVDADTDSNTSGITYTTT